MKLSNWRSTTKDRYIPHVTNPKLAMVLWLAMAKSGNRRGLTFSQQYPSWRGLTIPRMCHRNRLLICTSQVDTHTMKTLMLSRRVTSDQEPLQLLFIGNKHRAVTKDKHKPPIFAGFYESYRCWCVSIIECAQGSAKITVAYTEDVQMNAPKSRHVESPVHSACG